jgi:hypothetical protein
LLDYGGFLAAAADQQGTLSFVSVGGEELGCTAMATEDDDVVQESENEGEEMQGNDEINNAGANVSLVILAYFCK